MTEDRGDRALQRLGKDVVPLESAERAEERRARLVPGLTAFAEAEFAARKRRSTWRASAAGSALVVAAAAAAFVLLGRGAAPSLDAEPTAKVSAASGDVTVMRAAGGPGGVASAAMPLSASDRVHTEEGTAEVALRTGAAVELGPRTELALTATKNTERVDERLQLSTGSIRVRVPKLGNGQLVVTTPNAAVTVHGTVFTVEVRAGVTHVAVTEGKVSVESGGREIFLSPGASWSSSPVEPEPAPATEPVDASAATSARAPGNTSAKRSTLAQENALFRDALAARRSGDPARAVQLLDELLRRYPGSPLEPAARKERTFAEGLGRGTPKKP